VIIYELIYVLFCIPFAFLNKEWIDKDKKILHGWNGLLHIATAGIAWYLYGWIGFIVILCNTNVVFNIALNFFRGKPFDYVPIKPKSIIDKVERKIFGDDGILPKIIYGLTSIALNILYYVI
jgi:hypothetical protein